MFRFSSRVIDLANGLSYPILLVPPCWSVLLIWYILMYGVWLPSVRRGPVAEAVTQSKKWIGKEETIVEVIREIGHVHAVMGFGGQTLVAKSVLPTMTVLMWTVYWKFNGPDFLDPPLLSLFILVGIDVICTWLPKKLTCGTSHVNWVTKYTLRSKLIDSTLSRFASNLHGLQHENLSLALLEERRWEYKANLALHKKWVVLTFFVLAGSNSGP
jgi:hypothetical protein